MVKGRKAFGTDILNETKGTVLSRLSRSRSPLNYAIISFCLELAFFL